MLAALYATAIAILTIYGANLLWMAVTQASRDRLRTGAAPEPDALPDPPAEWPAVTVQLPVYNEPLVVERLIDACARLDYPRRKLEIQVLDDSTDYTPRVAARSIEGWKRRGVDIVHVRRDHRDGYKAGALQNGLRIARGDLIAIFDADFVPQKDFLRRVVPTFVDDERIGLVQARWKHLNADDSWLTRLQTIGLDMHFAVEQKVRAMTNCFLNFNGTAGVWRRACIEDAGGWQGDTIAEDLDLSYRAQLAGWSFRYLDDVAVPAELPSTISALRAQQFRWAKGSIEAGRKLIRPLWQSKHSLRIKLQGTIHLSAHVVFPFVLLAALIHAPLLLASAAGTGPSEAFFGWMALGLIGFAGFTLAQLLAQRRLYHDWPSRIRTMPAFMVGTVGLSLNNSRAVLEALIGRRTPFVRTPKYGGGRGSRVEGRPPKIKAQDTPDPRTTMRSPQLTTPTNRPPILDPRPSLLPLAEAIILTYLLVGLIALLAVGAFSGVPFQLFFISGFGLVTAANYRAENRYVRGEAAIAPAS